MSHYLDMKTTLSDPEAIARAITRMGIPRSCIELHNNAVTLNGYNGETRKANVLVRQQNLATHSQAIGMSGYRAYADLGFIKKSDGSYEALVDGSNFNTTWVNKLSTYYNVEKAKMELDSRKIKYTESTENSIPIIVANIPFRTHKNINAIQI